MHYFLYFCNQWLFVFVFLALLQWSLLVLILNSFRIFTSLIAFAFRSSSHRVLLIQHRYILITSSLLMEFGRYCLLLINSFSWVWANISDTIHLIWVDLLLIEHLARHVPHRFLVTFWKRTLLHELRIVNHVVNLVLLDRHDIGPTRSPWSFWLLRLLIDRHSQCSTRSSAIWIALPGLFSGSIQWSISFVCGCLSFRTVRFSACVSLFQRSISIIIIWHGIGPCLTWLGLSNSGHFLEITYILAIWLIFVNYLLLLTNIIILSKQLIS